MEPLHPLEVITDEIASSCIHLLRLRDGLCSAVHVRIRGHLRRGKRGGRREESRCSARPSCFSPPIPHPVPSRSLPAHSPGPLISPPLHSLDPYPLQPPYPVVFDVVLEADGSGLAHRRIQTAVCDDLRGASERGKGQELGERRGDDDHRN